MLSAHIVNEDRRKVLDVLGPTVEFLTPPDGSDTGYCVMLGTIPSGVSLPLHSHSDVEFFFILYGTLQVLICDEGGYKWLDAEAGDFIEIPGDARHAFRNVSNAPVRAVVMTTQRLGRFFQEVGRPVTRGVSRFAPTAEELQQFASVSAKYNHWLGSPQENAEIGISFEARNARAQISS